MQINTISRKKDFDRIFKEGEFRKGKIISIYFLKNDLNKIRFCIFLTKKVKKPIIRNRIKRVMKAALSRILYDIKENYDFLLIPQERVYYLKFNEVKDAIYEVLNKAGLIR